MEMAPGEPGAVDAPETETGRPVDALDALIWSLPVPTTPPRLDRVEAARGMVVLELALRQNHVVRVSEALSYRDRSYIERSVTVDVDLSQLSADQLRVLTQANASEYVVGPAATFIWLPIARHTSGVPSANVAVAANGEPLPRMTSSDSRTLIASGLVSLFRMLVESHPDTRVQDTALYSLLNSNNRARWLLESVISHYTMSAAGQGPQEVLRASDNAPRRQSSLAVGRSNQSDQTVNLDSDAFVIRTQARRALSVLTSPSQDSELQSPFMVLLETAAKSEVLTVLADTRNVLNQITYRAPRIPANRTRNGVHRWFRALAPQSGTFHGSIELTIPPNLRSHHVRLEVDEELFLSRMIMTTHVDMETIGRLQSACAALADKTLQGDISRVEAMRMSLGGTTDRKLLELELQSLAHGISEVATRRGDDLADYTKYLDKSMRRFGLRHLPQETEPAGKDPLAQMLSDDFKFEHLLGFAGNFRAGNYARLATDERITAPALRRLGQRLQDLEVGTDVTCDSDPGDSVGHVHWRHRHGGGRRSPGEAIRAVVSFTIADEAPSLVESNRRFLFALGGLVSVLAVSLFGWSWLLNPIPAIERAMGAARVAQGYEDALVTILLLVPGLLIARLSLPSRNSIVRDLRAFPGTVSLHRGDRDNFASGAHRRFSAQGRVNGGLPGNADTCCLGARAQLHRESIEIHTQDRFCDDQCAPMAAGAPG